MAQENMLREEKRRLLGLMNYEYVKLDFFKLTSILDNNLNEPRWMDVYVLLYKAGLPADITVYNILLEKLSKPVFWFYFIDGEKRYLANADELLIKRYVYYLITGESAEYYVKSQYIPRKDYIKEILKVSKFSECGIYLKHVNDNKFRVEPFNIEFETIDEAKKIYEELLDIKDFYTNINVDQKVFLNNYDAVLKLSKDKRMIATISNISSYFKGKFNIKDGFITVDGTDIKINDEETATSYQNAVIDAYHFFRNVINTTDRRDIISEMYNNNVSPEIKKEYEDNLSSYLKVIKNRDLIDWIVTISKESKYTLNITYDEQEVFYINGAIIVTPLDAKEYYIDYMDKKKEKLAVAIYKNTILNKIKTIWNKFRARFASA